MKRAAWFKIVLAASSTAAIFFAFLPLGRVLFYSNAKAAAVQPPHQNWRDGLYEGSAVTERGEARSVEVMVESGKIHHVRSLDQGIVSPVDAKVMREVARSMVAANSSDIDGVSGATMSSKTIIAAAQNALSKAEVKGE
ncbi:MAG: FMN-binding protein [Sporomusaceae bacterium]|nr:FMN-binding protein [Sporomusaceae bacterium]